MSEGNSTAPVFDDGKADGAMRTIGEVSRAFGIKPHVLRYWEQQFPMLQPLKRSGGRRLYRTEDLVMVETIDRLVNREGYTLKGARNAIKSGAAASAPAPMGATMRVVQAASVVAPKPDAGPSTTQVAQQLRAIRNRLAAALAD